MEYIEMVKQQGKDARGKNNLIKYLDEGKRLTQKQMIEAKCYDCMGFYADGKIDCRVERCALYPVMPYREGGPRKSMARSPRNVSMKISGNVLRGITSGPTAK